MKNYKLKIASSITVSCLDESTISDFEVCTVDPGVSKHNKEEALRADRDDHAEDTVSGCMIERQDKERCQRQNREEGILFKNPIKEKTKIIK